MLQIVLPLTDVHVAAGEHLRPFAFHLAIPELALVARLIRPDHHAFAFHIIVVEFPFIQLAGVCEVILAITMELTVEEISFIKSTLKFKSTLARLLSMEECADETDLAKVPRLGALAMLLVVLPLAIVHAPASVNEDTVSIGLTVLPLSLEDVSVSMRHATFSIESTVPRLAIVV